MSMMYSIGAILKYKGRNKRKYLPVHSMATEKRFIDRMAEQIQKEKDTQLDWDSYAEIIERGETK